jgi:Large polyvalent protein associated domain 38
VFQDGKRTVYKVDPDLARAMKGLDASSVGLIEKMLSIPASTLRAGAVATPDFALRRSIRDYLYAAITTKEGFFSPLDMARGFIGLITKDEDFWNWMKGGGGNVSMVSLDRRYLQDNLAKLTEQTGLATRAWNVVIDPNASWLQKGGAVLGLPFKAVGKYVIHPLQVLTELAESASHLGAFKREMRAAGTTGETLPAIPGQGGGPGKATIQDAAWTSRDTAVDASRIGASTRAYNMITAFANITIQDTDRIARAFKADPTGTALKIGGAIVAPSALLWWANHDDPRYQEVPQWQKDLFWIVMTKDHIYRIPKPFGMGQLFGSGTERTLEALKNGNYEAYKNWSKSIADAIVPQFYPTAAAPVIEQFANRSTFINRTLIPDSLEKQLPEYQYTPYTTELTKALGRIIASFPGVRETSIEPETLGGGPARAVSSPILIENYIRGWSGNLGVYALNAADLALRKAGVLPDPPKPSSTLSDIPVIKAFVIRYPTATTQSIQDFEDQYANNKKFYDTWMAKAKDGDADAMNRVQAAGGPRMFIQLDAIKSLLAEHNQLIRDVSKDPKSDPAEKRQLIDQLYNSMIGIGQYGKKAMKDIDAGLAR